MPELSTWRFVSIPDEAGNQAKMELGVNSITSRGTLVISQKKNASSNEFGHFQSFELWLP